MSWIWANSIVNFFKCRSGWMTEVGMKERFPVPCTENAKLSSDDWVWKAVQSGSVLVRSLRKIQHSALFARICSVLSLLGEQWHTNFISRPFEQRLIGMTFDSIMWCCCDASDDGSVRCRFLRSRSRCCLLSTLLRNSRRVRMQRRWFNAVIFLVFNFVFFPQLQLVANFLIWFNSIWTKLCFSAPKICIRSFLPYYYYLQRERENKRSVNVAHKSFGHK